MIQAEWTRRLSISTENHGHWKLSAPAPALPAPWQIKTGSLVRWRVCEEQSAATGTENFLHLLRHCRHHDRSRQAAWLDEESARNHLYSSLVALEHINNICEGYWVVVVVSWCFTPSQPVRLCQGDGYWSLCLTCKRRWRGRLPASLPLALTTTRLIG